MGTEPSRVVGYVRVSTTDQGESGAGLDVQREAIIRDAERRGWTVVDIYQDVASAKSMDKRPQLARAIQAVESGEAGTLMVYKLDRLSRSVVDFGAVMERARREGWNLVVIDLGVDLSTPAGEMVGSIMASLAQWERRIISQRTKEALSAKKRAGVKLGRPSGVDDDTMAAIRKMRSTGLGYLRIAQQLEAMQIPTSQGGKRWYPGTVKKLLVHANR